MGDDYRLDLLAKAIEKSDLDGATKDVLADDLRMAQKLGDTHAEQGIKRILISGIRRELLTHERITAAVNAHIDEWHSFTSGGVIKKALVSICVQAPFVAILLYGIVKLAKYKLTGLLGGG